MARRRGLGRVIGWVVVIAFLAVTTLTGDYTWVARVGGAGWVFLLSMIILMPTLAPWLRRRLEGR